MNFISDTRIDRKNKHLTAAAIAVSLFIHLAVVNYIGEAYLVLLRAERKSEIGVKEEVIHYRFVETLEGNKIEKLTERFNNISDKNSRVDSSRNGKVLDKAPKGEKKKDFQQLSKKASNSAKRVPFMKTEEMEQFKFENDVQSIEPDQTLKLLRKTDINFDKTADVFLPENSFINMPMISFGEATMSFFEQDSFLAAQTEAGKYFKEVRKKIELEWYKYMTFNYRTNNILGSEALIHFKIGKDGKILSIEKKYISGDFLFQNYCETAILNAGPFPEIPDSMDVLLKKGGFDISIYFGYDVSPGLKNKREENKENAREKTGM